MKFICSQIMILQTSKLLSSYYFQICTQFKNAIDICILISIYKVLGTFEDSIRNFSWKKHVHPSPHDANMNLIVHTITEKNWQFEHTITSNANFRYIFYLTSDAVIVDSGFNVALHKNSRANYMQQII